MGPSADAMQLVDGLQGAHLNIPELTSPELTARWELKLKQIELGNRAIEQEFDEGIRDFVTDVVRKVQGASSTQEGTCRLGANGASSTQEELKDAEKYVQASRI